MSSPLLCIYIQGYVDDICLLGVGKLPNTVSGLMQWALHCEETWRDEVVMSVNPDKSELNVFTGEGNLVAFVEAHFIGVTLIRSVSVKYLMVAMDSRLTWREHVDVKVRKAYSCGPVRVSVVRRGARDLKVVNWFYVSIIRPPLTLASLVWRPDCPTTNAKKRLNRVQRLACLGITGAMRANPTLAMEALASLHWNWSFRVRLGQQRIVSWSLGCWSYVHPRREHSSILMRL